MNPSDFFVDPFLFRFMPDIYDESRSLTSPALRSHEKHITNSILLLMIQNNGICTLCSDFLSAYYSVVEYSGLEPLTSTLPVSRSSRMS